MVVQLERRGGVVPGRVSGTSVKSTEKPSQSSTISSVDDQPNRRGGSTRAIGIIRETASGRHDVVVSLGFDLPGLPAALRLGSASKATRGSRRAGRRQDGSRVGSALTSQLFVLWHLRKGQHDISSRAILNQQMMPGIITGVDERSPHPPQHAHTQGARSR